MHTALLKQNPETSKWEVIFNGVVLMAGTKKGNVRHAVKHGLNASVREAGVTELVEVGSDTVVALGADQGVAPEGMPRIEDLFTIHERFDIVSDYVDMVAKKQRPSAIVTGTGGLGKSHTVLAALEAAGLEKFKEIAGAVEDLDDEVDGAELAWDTSSGFVVIKGYMTAKNLFRTLYRNRDRIVLFDDCDKILKDPAAVDVLKAALDSYEERVVTWGSETPFGSDLPRSFEFTGGIVFISNMSRAAIPQPIRDRASNADVTMSRQECLDRMEWVIAKGTFMPEVNPKHVREAMDFLTENAFHPLVKSVSLRTLIATVLNRVHKPENWQRLSLYNMMNSVE
jgi:hypothetical protein